MLYRPVIVSMMAMIMTAAAVFMVFMVVTAVVMVCMVMTVIVTAVTVFMVCMIMVVVVTAAASIYRIPSFLFHSKILLNKTFLFFI